MQTVSQYYLDAITAGSNAWSLKIIAKYKKTSSSSITLNDEDVQIGSVVVERTALKDQFMGVEGSSSAKLTFKLTFSGLVKMENASRLNKKTFLDFWAWLKTADPNQDPDDWTQNTDHTENESGRVHIGEFVISEISVTQSDATITAYDAMSAFDREIEGSYRAELNTVGVTHTMDYYLGSWCTYCTKGSYSVVLDPNLDFESLPNYHIPVDEGEPPKGYHLDADSIPDTFRTLVKDFAELTGNFATITRDGKLTFVFFDDSAPVAAIASVDVFESEFSGQYYSIDALLTSVSGEDIIIPATYEDRDDDLIVVSFNENMFLRAQYDPESNQPAHTCVMMIMNMRAAIGGSRTGGGVKFTGGNFKTVYRPELDLGDMLNVTVYQRVGNQFQDVTYHYVMCGKIVETFGQTSSITSPEYPGLTKATTKTSVAKNAGGGGGGGGSQQASIVIFDGEDAVNVGQTNTTLFANKLVRVKAEMPLILWFTGVLEADQATAVEFIVKYRGVFLPFNFRFQIPQGKQTVSFNHAFQPVTEETVESLSLYIKSDGGNVQIASGEYQLSVYSSGAESSEPEWTGFYEQDEIIPDIEFSQFIEVENITASVTATTS